MGTSSSVYSRATTRLAGLAVGAINALAQARHDKASSRGVMVVEAAPTTTMDLLSSLLSKKFKARTFKVPSRAGAGGRAQGRAALGLLVALFANSVRVGTAGSGYTDPVARGTGVPEQKTQKTVAY